MWKLCGLTEVQCAVVSAVFIEVLAYWHLVLINGLHYRELCDIGCEHLLPFIQCGMIVALQFVYMLVFFSFCIELQYFSIRSF